MRTRSGPVAAALVAFAAVFVRDGFGIMEAEFESTVILRSSQRQVLPNALVLDGNGHVYVCGSSVSLGPSGDDPAGNPMVPVNSNELGMEDVTLTRVSMDGTYEWSRLLGSPQKDRCNGVAVGDDGDVYIIGTTHGYVEAHGDAELSADEKAGDVLFARFTDSGDAVWVHQHARDTEEQGWAIRVVGNSIYMFGTTTGSLTTNDVADDTRKLFVSALGTDGAHDSMRSNEITTGADVSRVNVDLVEDGKHAFACVSYNTDDGATVSVYSLNLRKLTAEWEFTYAGDSHSVFASGVAVTSAGPLISGTLTKDEEFGDQFWLLQVSNKGEQVWSSSDGVQGSDDRTTGAFPLDSGNSILAGDTQGAYGRERMQGEVAPVMIIVDSEGNIILKYQMDVHNKQAFEVHAAVLSTENNAVYMVQVAHSDDGTGGLQLGTFGLPNAATIDDAAASGGNQIGSHSGFWARFARLPVLFLVSAAAAASLILALFVLVLVRRVRSRREDPIGFEDIVYEDAEDGTPGQPGSMARVKSAGGVVRIPRGYVEPSLGNSR